MNDLRWLLASTPARAIDGLADDVGVAGVAELMDVGYVPLDAKKATATNFITTCRKLRFWDREPTV